MWLLTLFPLRCLPQDTHLVRIFHDLVSHISQINISFVVDLSRENLAVIPDDEENGDHGDERDVKYFDSIISDFMRERAIPGASVAISKNGEFLFRRGGGLCPW